MKDQRGRITLFAVIIMPMIIVISMTLIEIINIKVKSNEFYGNLSLFVDDILSDFDKNLYSEYGLIGINKSTDITKKTKGFYLNSGSSDVEVSAEYCDPLFNYYNLKKQILDETRIKSLVSIGKELIDKFKYFGDINTNLVKGNSKEEISKELQGKVAENMKEIKSLEERKKGGESGLDDKIKDLYSKNKDLLDKSEDVLDSDLNKDKKSTDNFNEAMDRIGKAFGEDKKISVGNPIDTFYEGKKSYDAYSNIFTNSLFDLRDNLLINEYIIDKFSNLRNGNGEVENIINWGNKYKIIGDIFLMRTVIDCFGYMNIDQKSPPGLIAKLIYSALMGVGTGAYDTAKLLLFDDDNIPLVTILPESGNFLEKIKLNYRNHLQLFLLIKNEEDKIINVAKTISINYPGTYYTGVEVRGTFNIDLGILGRIGNGAKIFGGEIKNGKFVFNKVIHKVY